MLNKSGPSLKHFILRQQALNLYRHTVRASRVIPDPVTRRETVAWIRGEFERNRHITDTAVMEDKLRIARREIQSILPTSQRSA